jgi:hypothetical protein
MQKIIPFHDGNTLLVFENLTQKWEAKTNAIFQSELLLVCLNREGETLWSRFLASNQEFQGKNGEDFSKVNTYPKGSWNADVTVSEKSVNILFRRPSVDKRVNLSKGNDFLTVWVSLTPDSGELMDQEGIESINEDANQLYVRKYVEFQDTKEEIKR